MPYTLEQMHEYGYRWDQMVPLTYEEAYEFIKSEEQGEEHVFYLNRDGSEGRVTSLEQMDAHKGMFGVEKNTYENYINRTGPNKKLLRIMEDNSDVIEAAFRTEKGYFTIQSEQEGFRYAFYDEDLLLTDQGIFPYVQSLDRTVDRLMDEHFLKLEHCRWTDYDSLMFRVENRWEGKTLDFAHVELKRDRWLMPEAQIHSVDEATEVMKRILKNQDRECFAVLNLSTQGQVINASVCSVGTIRAAIVEPGAVFRTAICSSAASVIAFHNHPSGICSPSKNDDVVTRNLARAGRLIGIQLEDHIIIGDPDSYSYYENRREFLEPDSQEEELLQTAEKGTYVSRKERVAQITQKLQQAVKDFCSGEQFTDYLKTISKFHNYSFNNCLLIALQRPDATMVAGYNAWIKDFNRHVNKGEKGIQILSPVWKKELNDTTGKEEEKIVGFRPAYVFDISQTDGKEIPMLAKELESRVPDFETRKQVLIDVSKVPITFEETAASTVHGYYHMAEKRIVVRPDLSESQTLKTLVHEIAHSEMHAVKEEKRSAGSREVEAESVAFTVSDYFGLDTSDYSFGYIAGWSSNTEFPELQASMKRINDTASDLISRIEEQIKVRTKTRVKEEVKSDEKKVC